MVDDAPSCTFLAAGMEAMWFSRGREPAHPTPSFALAQMEGQPATGLVGGDSRKKKMVVGNGGA